MANLLNLDSNILFYSLAGGIFPALFWLWFWLREDANHPEPRRLIFSSFLMGGLSTLIVLPLELVAKSQIGSGLYLIIAWAAIEEIAKYVFTATHAFRQKEFDEPIDALIYLITVALGFAAFENVLFLLKTFANQGVLAGILIGNIRFIGASLLHIISSSVVGAAIAFTFYKSAFLKKLSVITGLILATALHSFFNFFIMKEDGQNMFSVFVIVWIAIIGLILFFEKAKRIKN